MKTSVIHANPCHGIQSPILVCADGASLVDHRILTDLSRTGGATGTTRTVQYVFPALRTELLGLVFQIGPAMQTPSRPEQMVACRLQLGQ